MRRFVRGGTINLAMLFLATASLQAGVISLVPGGNFTIGVDALDAVNGVHLVDGATDPPPLSLSLVADNLNGTTASILGAVSDQNGLASVGFSFALRRSDVPGATASAYGSVLFQVLGDAPYTLEGDYTFGGISNAYFEAQLVDVTAALSEDVFVSEQISVSSPSGQFILGGMDGNLSNLSTGNLGGTLTSGHWYEFSFDVLLQTPDSILELDMVATAKGSVSLSIGKAPAKDPGPIGSKQNPTADVPEPASLALFGVGSLGLFFVRRRQSMS